MVQHEQVSGQNRWDRIQDRFKNNIIGVCLLMIVTMTSAIVGLTDASKKLFEAIWPEQSSLVIAPLDGLNRLSPLEGHRIIKASQDQPIHFPVGVKVKLDLGHNNKGKEAILVRQIELVLDKYTPGNIYAYDIDGDAVHGAGTAKPYIYHVSLSGSQVQRAFWVKDAGDIAQAMTSNFLDIKNPVYITVAPNEHPQPVEVLVTALEPGLYEFHFRLGYTTSNEDKELATSHIFIVKAPEE